MPPTTTATAAPDRYKWMALSNTTLGMLMATINSSILLIALPDIFRGIHIDPLAPGNTSYLLWMILGFLVVMAVLVVSLGRLGDIYGRVRMFNLGFAVFTALLDPALGRRGCSGSAAAIWLILMRVGRGSAARCCSPTRRAILTDAFPSDQRGLALGINSVAAIAGSFIGLVLGGSSRRSQWRLVFLVSVPIGVSATVWAYRKLARARARAAGADRLVGQRDLRRGAHRGDGRDHLRHPAVRRAHDGLDGAVVLAALIGGARPARRVLRRSSSASPSRCSTSTCSGSARSPRATSPALLAAMGRGGLQFILIIWLQGIWLPAARLRLHRDAALGRHLHAAADRRLPRRRPGVRLPLRPLRRAAVRDRRDARSRRRASCC